jgi:leucine dehydrogenase
MLVKEGAKVMISDIFQDKIQTIVDAHGVEVIDVEDVYETEMDIYSPCALGATVNDETLSKLKCAIICGAANNQLADEAKHGRAVMDKGIIYAPDYLVNAGGIINCFWEINGYHKEAAMHQTEGIYDTTLDIFKTSAAENIPTYLAANKLAEARIEAIGNVQLTY